MQDPIDVKIKAEIDEIMEHVENILKKIETLYPTQSETSKQHQEVT